MSYSETEEYSLKDLCREAEVTERTIRYYIQEDLLPPPEGAGQATRYTGEHLLRLRIIRRLKEEYLPLSEIRRRLTGLSMDELESLAAKLEETTPPAVSETSSAKQYLDNLLQSKASFAQPPPPMVSRAAPAPIPAPMPSATAGGAVPDASLRESLTSKKSEEKSVEEGEEWRRVKIAPEVELNYRPGSQENQQRIASLLELARKIFNTK